MVQHNYRSIRYNPHHQRQINASDKNGSVNCSAYAAAMAMDGATLGGMVVTGKLVRALSNEPVPDPKSPGLNIPQIVAVSKKLHVPLTDRTGKGWTQMLRDLDAGSYVVLQGDYDQMGASSCQPSFKDGHMVVVTHRYNDGTANVHDPLCKTGKKVPLTTLRHYAEKLLPGVRYAITRKTPNYAKV